MTVRFATTCDSCGARSEEYTAWPTCYECHDHVCRVCEVPGSFREGDASPDHSLCQTCHTTEE